MTSPEAGTFEDIKDFTNQLMEDGIGWASLASAQPQVGTQDEQAAGAGIQTYLAFEESINNSIFFGLNLQPLGFNSQIFGLYTTYYRISQLLDAGIATDVLTAYTDDVGDLYDAAGDFIDSYIVGTWPGTLDNERKRLLVRAFTNYQTLGFFDAVDLSSTFGNIARLVDINASVNSKLAMNIMKRAAEQDINIFGSTFDSLLPSAAQIQENASLIPPGIIDQADVSVITDGETWQPYQLFDMDNFPRDGTNPYDRAVPVGYVIDKFRESSSGEIVTFDRIYIEGAEANTYIDPLVAYGARYYYTVRTVFLTEFNAVNIAADETGTDEGQSLIARVLVASRGSALEVIDTIDEEAPQPPDTIKFSYDPEQDGLLIYWEYPPTPGTDIESWQVFKRKTLYEPYQLIKQIKWSSFTNRYERVPNELIETTQVPKNFYTDKSFSTFSTGYYAVCAVDKHGYSSGYSTQYYVTYNYQSQRTNARKVSRKDAPKPYPNFYIEEEPIVYREGISMLDTTKFELFVDTMKSSGHNKLKVYFDPEYYTVEDDRDPSDPSGDPLADPIIIPVFESGFDFGVPRYKLTILNVDLQKSEIVDISITETE